MKKILTNILSLLVILTGGVWFLQGINILPGSFMTGQVRWAVYGIFTILIGIGLFVWANRQGSASD
jgi:hypothetical protein